MPRRRQHVRRTHSIVAPPGFQLPHRPHPWSIAGPANIDAPHPFPGWEGEHRLAEMGGKRRRRATGDHRPIIQPVHCAPTTFLYQGVSTWMGWTCYEPGLGG